MAKSLQQIWNEFDEFGLLVGIKRIPGETNAELRHRILNHPVYDSTKQGMLNSLCDALLVSPYNVTTRKAFSSLRQPLSLVKYQEATGSSGHYHNPQVIVGSTTWTIEPSSLADRDYDEVDGVTWSLWKQPDGSYDRNWTVNVNQEQNVELVYQWLANNGQVYLVREKPTLNSWSSGSIVEVDPDE